MSEAGKSPRQFSVEMKREIDLRVEAGEAVGKGRAAPDRGIFHLANSRRVLPSGSPYQTRRHARSARPR